MTGASKRVNGQASGPVLYASVPYSFSSLCSGHRRQKPDAFCDELDVVTLGLANKAEINCTMTIVNVLPTHGKRDKEKRGG